MKSYKNLHCPAFDKYQYTDKEDYIALRGLYFGGERRASIGPGADKDDGS